MLFIANFVSNAVDSSFLAGLSCHPFGNRVAPERAAQSVYSCAQAPQLARTNTGRFPGPSMSTFTAKTGMTLTVAPRDSLKTRITLSMLALFLAGLWSLSYYASRILHVDMERALGDQQFSTVSVMASSVDHALTDRLNALDTVAAVITTHQLEHPDTLQAHLETLPLLQNFFNAGVIAYRMDGTAIADTSPSAGRIGVNYMDIDTIAAALRDGKSTVGRPVIGKKLLAPVFGMTVPIRNARNEVLGALSGVTNLGTPNFLDQITQARYSKTGGYMLVSPQHRLIVTATDKSRVMEVLPATGSNPLIDRFFRGFEGSGVTVNRLGVEVLASAKSIGMANWYVAAALPTAEAFAPIHNMLRRMLLATMVLTLAAGALTWWTIRRQLAPLMTAAGTLAAMSASERPPQPLPVTRRDEIGQVIGGFNRLLVALAQREDALKRNERKFLDILENVDAYIYLKDINGRYLFANRAMRRMRGVGVDGMVGSTDDAFLDPKTVEQLRANDRQVLENGTTLKTDETVVHRTTGTTAIYLSVKLPLRNDVGAIYALCGISTDITERKKIEEERRIAAIAFECQEGMLVLDDQLKILRVNHAFTQITGYSREEVEGRISVLARADLRPSVTWDAAWDQVQRTGSWQGDLWHTRKNGEDYLCRTTITVVRDETGKISHFVGNFTDATDLYLQEKKRLQHEAAHRNALVREVHHRIKNNLQGITGLLRQFAAVHPETREPLNQAISQVRSVAVLHGLQGRKSMDTVRLCELTSAIADDVQAVWQVPIHVDIPPQWVAGVVAENEAVPMALVINELIVNAVKHGGKAHGQVQVRLRKGERPEVILVAIENTGELRPTADATPDQHIGLHLVSSLMPRHGVTLTREQCCTTVITRLHVEPPVVTLEPMEIHDPEQHNAAPPPFAG